MKDRIKFLENVAAELVRWERTIALYKDMTKPIAPDNAIGRVSRMDAINNKSINDAALREAEKRYDKLLLALERVDDPGFGICHRCRRPIPEGRLMLMPESVLCVGYASH